jgi:phage-related protein
MAGNPQIVVDYIADTSGLDKAAGGVKGLGANVKGLGKAALAAGGVAGFAFLAASVKTGAEEMSNAQRVSAQTDAALKSTGKTAHVTAGDVDALATSIMNKSGIDDEAVQSAENMLLTFTNVRNEVGKGNDVFNRATQAVADLSTRMAGGAAPSAEQMQKSSVLLGKALNDPIKGLTALTRVGVSFDEGQRNRIKGLVEQGDTLKAQKLILAEVNKEFGGSAEAMGKTLPGQVDILKQSFANLAGSMTTLLVPAFAAITKFLTEHPALFKALVIAIMAVSVALIAMNAAMVVTAALEAAVLWPVLAIIAGLAALAAIAYVVYKNWDSIKAALSAAWDGILAAVQAVWNWIQSNWPLLLGILTGPVGLAVAAIIQNWDTIKGAIQAVLDAVTGAVSTAWTTISDGVAAGVAAITGAVSTAWGLVKGAVDSVLGGITGAVAAAWTTIQNAVAGAVGLIQTAVSTAWGLVKTAIDKVVGDIEDAVSKSWTTIKTTVTGAIDTIKSTAQTAWAAVSSAVDTASAAVQKTINTVLSPVLTGIKTVIQGVGEAFDAVRSAAQSVVTLFTGVLGKAVKTATGILNPVAALVQGIADAFNAVASAISNMITWIGKIPSEIHLPDVTGGLGGLAKKLVPGWAEGGLVTRPTLGVVGEAGPEIVAPVPMFRDMIAAAANAGGGGGDVHVRVFIGERELSDLIRVEVNDANTGLARTLLAGGVG